jgi:hypothetical protein
VIPGVMFGLLGVYMLVQAALGRLTMRSARLQVFLGGLFVVCGVGLFVANGH